MEKIENIEKIFEYLESLNRGQDIGFEMYSFTLDKNITITGKISTIGSWKSTTDTFETFTLFIKDSKGKSWNLQIFKFRDDEIRISMNQIVDLDNSNLYSALHSNQQGRCKKIMLFVSKEEACLYEAINTNYDKRV